MSERSWLAKVEEKTHTISINISMWDGTHVVSVDGVPVCRSAKTLFQPSIKEHHFEVGGKPALLVAKNMLAGIGLWDFELFVDGNRV